MNTRECRRVRRDIPFYLEGEMEPGRALQTAVHLASCGDCAGEARTGGKVLSTLRALPEPEPPRDIAGSVLVALRAMKRSLGPGAALKWSSLSLVLAAALWPALHPGATFDFGVRIVTRLGELVNVEALLGGLLDLVPASVPSLGGLLDMGREGVSTSFSSPSLALLILLPLLLLAAGVVFAFLSGGLVFDAVQSSRATAFFRKTPPRGPFDNPPGLP